MWRCADNDGEKANALGRESLSQARQGPFLIDMVRCSLLEKVLARRPEHNSIRLRPNGCSLHRE